MSPVRDALGVLRRRWYVMLVIAAAACACGVILLRDGGSYTSTTVVSFTWPGVTTTTPYNGSDTDSVITFARAVATEVNGNGSREQYYSHLDAPLYGAGLREAVVVAVGNEGSQWITNVNSAILEVQVVGRTEQWVRDAQTSVLDEIVGTADVNQKAAGVPADARIVVHIEPLTTAIAHIEPSRTAVLAGVAALAAAAAVVGGALSHVMDRWTARRRMSRTAREMNARSAT